MILSVSPANGAAEHGFERGREHDLGVAMVEWTAPGHLCWTLRLNRLCGAAAGNGDTKRRDLGLLSRSTSLSGESGTARRNLLSPRPFDMVVSSALVTTVSQYARKGANNNWDMYASALTRSLRAKAGAPLGLTPPCPGRPIST